MAKRNESDFDTTTTSYDDGEGRLDNLSRTASDQIDNSPLIALGAGVALGAVLGAVLPASRKERELLQPIGAKLNNAGGGAIERGREMAKQRFDEMAGDKVREFFGSSSSSGGSSTAA